MLFTLRRKWFFYEVFTDEKWFFDAMASLQNSPFGTFILKGIVHSKIKVLLSFIHPDVVPNVDEFLFSVELKGRYFDECW